MIPFKYRSTPTLAPAAGWASAAPWAMFHQEKPSAEQAPSEDSRSSHTPLDDPSGCQAGSWAY
jgi:hypothetical protein